MAPWKKRRGGKVYSYAIGRGGRAARLPLAELPAASGERAAAGQAGAPSCRQQQRAATSGGGGPDFDAQDQELTAVCQDQVRSPLVTRATDRDARRPSPGRRLAPAVRSPRLLP